MTLQIDGWTDEGSFPFILCAGLIRSIKYVNQIISNQEIITKPPSPVSHSFEQIRNGSFCIYVCNNWFRFVLNSTFFCSVLIIICNMMFAYLSIHLNESSTPSHLHSNPFPIFNYWILKITQNDMICIWDYLHQEMSKEKMKILKRFSK